MSVKVPSLAALVLLAIFAAACSAKGPRAIDAGSDASDAEGMTDNAADVPGPGTCSYANAGGSVRQTLAWDVPASPARRGASASRN